MKIRHFFLNLCVVSAALFVSNSYAKYAASSGEAQFRVHATAGMTIVGKTTQLSVKDDDAMVSVTVGLNSVDTGIGLRDKHTLKYLETDKYPSTVLTVQKSTLKLDGSEASGQGTLTLHGVTKPIQFSYVATKAGNMADVKGNYKINFNDFGIHVPSYLGVSVKPDVEVTAQFKVTDN